MTGLLAFLSLHAARLTALAIIVVLYGLTRLPQLPSDERAQLAAQFAFTPMALPTVPGPPIRSVRQVHPSLDHISAWISSVGASAALSDIDGDGLPNDVCYVDVRTDQVIVAPVPGTGERYPPFALDPTPVGYNPSATAPMGCLLGDLNEDGLMDILVYYWGRTPIAFLRKADTETDHAPLSTSSYVTQDIWPGGERWFTNAATFADLDGDGHVDLIIGNYFQDGAEILDAAATGSAEMQHSMSRAYNGGRNRLLLWAGGTSGAQPSVEYVDASWALDDEIAMGWTLAVGAADLDGDLLPEVYFSNDFGPDRLLHNRSRPGELAFVVLEGRKTLTTPSSKVLGRDSFKGMGVDFGDINGDGLLDIYVSNIADEFSLQESHFVFVSTGELERMQDGVAPYVDRSEELGLSRSGWGWESRLADFNNSGVLEAIQATGFVKGAKNRWPELHELAKGNDELLKYPGSWPRIQPGDDLSGHQHNPFFVRAQDGRYYDLAPDIGLDATHVTRGIATADVNGNGMLDFVIANQWEPSYFYRNDCPKCGAFLGLHLLLPVSGARKQTVIKPGQPVGNPPARPAIGATVVVHHPDGRRLMAQVDAGNGHSGARSPDLHFGLGDLDSSVKLEVNLHWRDTSGRVHHDTVRLSSGWHTIVLASGE